MASYDKLHTPEDSRHKRAEARATAERFIDDLEQAGMHGCIQRRPAQGYPNQGITVTEFILDSGRRGYLTVRSADQTPLFLTVGHDTFPEVAGSAPGQGITYYHRDLTLARNTNGEGEIEATQHDQSNDLRGTRTETGIAPDRFDAIVRGIMTLTPTEN